MPVRDIVVVGFSAGGIEPLLRLVEALPADFPGAVFIVHHFPPQSVSALPNILQRASALDVVQAVDGDAIVPGRICVAHPDQHLVLTGGRVGCTNGPREQGHRPAIDPLFRSAAQRFGSRVVGVILSGTLDDGTVGMIEIKARGGLALVQEPEEAAYPGMIMSALRNVSVDHVAPAQELAVILDRVAREEGSKRGKLSPDLREDFAAGSGDAPDPAIAGTAALRNPEALGQPSPMVCPECGGVLFEREQGDFLHFRCHVGHAFSEEALYASQSRSVEAALWSAVRALEERAELSRRLAQRAGHRGLSRAGSQFEVAAREAEHGSNILRRTLLKNPVRRDPLDAEAEPGDAELQNRGVEALSREPEFK
jgi:two-component system, chemotaxis family, protein-glutamate methylesterase/glutaminase